MMRTTSATLRRLVALHQRTMTTATPIHVVARGSSSGPSSSSPSSSWSPSPLLTQQHHQLHQPHHNKVTTDLLFRRSNMTAAETSQSNQQPPPPPPAGSSSFAAAAATAEMFCFQCSQTDQNKGCQVVGVCGKDAETAALQDLLIDQLKRLAFVSTRQQTALSDDKVQALGKLMARAAFSTLTNVNFDAEQIREYITAVHDQTAELAGTCTQPLPKSANGITVDLDEVAFHDISTLELSHIARSVGVQKRKVKTNDEDVTSVQELITYGLKGTAAYFEHAHQLGYNDANMCRKFIAAFDTISPFGKNEKSVEKLLGEALALGNLNFEIMGLLDHAHTTLYGHPEPTKVRRDPIPGKCILISGHDIADTYALLQQTTGTGINIYTHGELLPAHGYPELKKFPHFAGHYGGAWQNQRAEFPFFPGPIILTTNCLMEPRKSYADRVYTANAVGFDGIKRLHNRDFTNVIQQALELDGFSEDDCPTSDGDVRYFMTGFGHNAILSQADKILSAINSGQLKHFFVVGGCDGSNEKRSYYRDLVAATPKDSIIITMACGKYRFNDQWETLGTIGDIPRLLDMGQCNDSFGAVRVAATLAQVLKTDVNSLPLSFAISWYEQKAVAVLLSLLHLGIRNIHLGPTIPAFLSPNILQTLVDKFAIRPIGGVQEDLDMFLAPKQ